MENHKTWFIVGDVDTPICCTMRIYLTHCSAKKNDGFKDKQIEVPPDRLYTAAPTVRFMERCKAAGVPWAILSDKYGVWFPSVKHRWYEKSPDTVTQEELQRLIENINDKLQVYDEIFFYHNPGRFHPLYQKVIDHSSLTDRITKISHLTEIV